MAMVVRANHEEEGIGGHISTYASAATLYEVAFNHFFHGKGEHYDGDQIFFQGHASPGIYARAFLEVQNMNSVFCNNLVETIVYRHDPLPEGNQVSASSVRIRCIRRNRAMAASSTGLTRDGVRPSTT